MRRTVARASIIATVVLAFFVRVSPVQAQIRGLYPPGMNATNSGVMPEPGLSYQALFQLYSFDELTGPLGQSFPVNGTAAVLVDQNIIMWVSKAKLLGGNYAAVAVPTAANNSLTSATFGAIAAGAGFADSYYQPFTLGWHLTRADIQSGYGFVAPTGAFTARAVNNVGAGYWGQLLISGETVYLTSNKGTAVSAFEAYEFHGRQATTNIHPGQTFDIDYSVMQSLPLLNETKHGVLQVGLVGYGQYQTTNRNGPGVDPVVAANNRYKVNALGPAANVILLDRKFAVGFKYFKEFQTRSTVEGHSVQISGSITF
jgi:hypothetical protein